MLSPGTPLAMGPCATLPEADGHGGSQFGRSRNPSFPRSKDDLCLSAAGPTLLSVQVARSMSLPFPSRACKPAFSGPLTVPLREVLEIKTVQEEGIVRSLADRAAEG